MNKFAPQSTLTSEDPLHLSWREDPNASIYEWIKDIKLFLMEDVTLQ
jgi:hypothetical protein